MSSEQNLSDLISRVSNLTININITTGAGPEVPSSTAAGSASGAVPAPSASTQRATTSPSCTAWFESPTPPDCPADVLLLSRRIRSALQGLSPEERIRTAYRRGREAAQILRGEITCYKNSGIDSRRTVYVVLSCDSVADPFYTTSLTKYLSAVRTGPGGTWDPASVSHGFASITEAEAFCRGAGLRSLPLKLD